jgi:23S rRNA (adenine2503-C2)-methyltransferase
MMIKESLFGKTLVELEAITAQLGIQRFVAKQIADWLYKKHVDSLEQMTNLSLKMRELLNEKYIVGRVNHIKVQESVDGTKKYLYPSMNNKFIEAAYIPDKERATLCISSQVGCKMGCLFCMTGKQGFQGQLSACEIVNQIGSLPERDNLTNIVYMGMGEPFDNITEVLKSLDILTAPWGYAMSPKRVTVSTIGIIPGMKQFLKESKCHLAVSMHSPFDEERRKLMPIQHVYPIHDVLNEIRSFDFGLQRRVSFEYIMFKGINDSHLHVKELTKILNGIKCRINLIKFHPIPNTPLESTSDANIEFFRDSLNNKGIVTTIRQSRGQDIYAACGLLSTKELLNQNTSDF